jgi:hypothetical protein
MEDVKKTIFASTYLRGRA